MTDTTASSPDSDPAKKTTSDVATATTTAAASQPAERGRRSALQSGFSLLARGEPQIWFTGGMLILCLAMIVGLLGLILVSGLPTFWPKRLDLIALDDGQLEIGQPQKLQVRTVSSQTGAEGPQKKETRPSRYYRTANADITGQHFRWIDPDQTAANGIASPEWAMVVERETWGRLHGLPLSLTETIPLPEDTLNELRQLDEFIDLIGTLRSVDSTEEMSQAAEELTELLVKTRASRHSAELRSAIEALSISESTAIQVDVGDGQWQAFQTIVQPATQGGTLTAARLLTTEPFALHDRLQASIQRSSYLRHHVEGLRYKISRLDEHISKLRAAVRLAELNTESPAAQQVEQSHYLVEQQLALERRAEQVDAVIQLVESLRGDAASEMTDRALNWLSATRAALPQQITEQQTQIDQWLEPVGQQPPQMQTAFKQYLHGYREIATEKQPLLRELEISEAQLALDQVSFAVPVDSTQLTEFTLDEIASLRAGKLSDPVRERLTQASIEAVSITPQPLNEVTNLFTVLDRQGQAHMLAVTLIHYVAAENGGESDEQTVRLLSNKLLNSSEIIRVVAVNRLSLGGKFSVYFDRWREFLTENPRDNTEGGVFPAIWGTVVMTLIMTIAVVPFGVMAALYLREYTHAGPLVSLIRISINNLAGVPSIVYGVFGFSFFCYLIGAYIDGGPKNANVIPLPSAAWFASMSVTAVVGTSAFLLSFFGSGPAHTQTATKRWFSKIALVLWIACVAAMAYLLLKSPFFDGFYREYLPNPTFGKGGLLWAALTLSLLTLPVVIVATEEALAAVPNSLREGSLACGASKWQTIRRIILPHARPGILTGAILAMARGAGEVAPLMLVGALPSAPDLPLDNEFPFFHGSRSFMHLGYQIYTLGFQSPNSEAAKPMVFTCTLLLILIVAALNISAIYLRARLKRRFQGNQF